MKKGAGERGGVPGVTTEWAAGWPLVLSAFLGFSYFSIMTFSLSVFIEPIEKEFGWTRVLTSSGVLVSSIVTAILSPFVGMLIDRFGARRLALPGIVSTALSISAFAFADASPTRWIMLWAAFAFLSISIKTTVWTSAVASRFERERGLALGITLCGLAAAQAVLPPLATWLIDSFGWRAAYVWLGLGWGGMALLMSWLFFYDARDLNPRNAAPGVAPRANEPGLTIAQACADPALRRISASTLLLMLVSSGLFIHQIPILTESGIGRVDAAWLASLVVWLVLRERS